MFLTFAVNVPMNEALVATAVPDDIASAGDIWRAYSDRWKLWNEVRAIGSGAALASAGIGAASSGMLRLPPHSSIA
ncbi:anthrone oxygenase family protein [Pseudaminobacter sp. NGMCC 1.201702]|uniref:anthrone oxygenase family protein n=1 Tax=Pseudaminobacter sp. NGMCC 1.201702 TaxID=3391825 RepID=UPI0039EE2C06